MRQQNYYDIVKYLLETEAQCRDYYEETQWRVYEITHKQRLSVLTKNQFMEMNNESVRRAWQKVRELHPELKGRPEIEAKRNKRASLKGTFIWHEAVMPPVILPKPEPVQVNLFA